jgi:tol-pal system protein YbgF
MKYLSRHRSLILCLLLSPFLVQCIATQQDLKSMELRLRTVNNKLINMDRNFDDLQEETTSRANKNTVEALQKHQASTANDIDELKTGLLQVKGQIEENTHHYRKLQEDAVDYRDSLSTRFHDLNDGIESLRASQDELGARIDDLGKRISENEARFQQFSAELSSQKEAKASAAAKKARRAAEKAAQTAQEAKEAKERAAEKARKARTAAASAAGPRTITPENIKKTISGSSTTKAPKQGVKTAGDPARRLYDSGMAAFAAKKFQEAYGAFTNYIEKYPKGKLIANARFWLGDSLYSQKEYELAILEYQKVIADYPKHDKAPAALLKQGLAFEKLKDTETAKLVYYKLDDDYPGSKEAAAGKKRLQKLK